MSKVRINDLAREMEVKSRQVLDILAELGLATGKPTPVHWRKMRPRSSRAFFAWIASREHGRHAGFSRPQAVAPKIDLSHISKPGTC